ncbi:ABC transporter permease [Streptomyces chartreusis]|uniref:ABC transporter permease n=1 Tax=Streptomyces chartreusis TaxID=1969 RepID=UPI003865F707|nr:ABC transporter permease [Streptomyces chartreusis]WTA33485.1 ABC transporter permease [Streptomyces chartreusis]
MHARAVPRSSSIGSVVRRVFSIDEIGPLLALIVLVVIIGAFHPKFLEPYVLLNTVRSAAFVAIAAYGMVFLLSMTEIDLSVGGIYAVSVIVAARWMSDIDPWLAAGLAILVAMGMGAFNGILANTFRIPVIIITLGTFSAYRGLVQVISGGRPATGLPMDSSFFLVLGQSFLGAPIAAWAAVLLGVVLTIVFKATRFGAMVRASGSNHAAAEFSGIPIRRIRLYALMLTGGLSGLAGILSFAYYQGADLTVGVGFELQVIAAAIIGGTAVSGGKGTVPGALIGALIVSVINSGLVFFEVDPNWTNFATGAVVVLAVCSDAVIRRRRARIT